MSKVDLLIWSKDRACQLDLLLRSIKLNASDVFNIQVLYTSSNEHFEDGYSKLSKEHAPVLFWREHDFETQTRNIINTFDEYCSFATDDCVVFDKVGDLQPNLPASGQVFSLRLGLNTLIQNYHTGEYQPPLYNYVVNNGVIEWNPHEYHPLHNYGYPFGLDLHIFNTRQINDLLTQFGFKTTNELESKLFNFRNVITTMKSFKESKTINIPCNTLSSVTRAGEKFGFSLGSLNEDYLSGKVIDLEVIMRHRFLGCHEEFNLELV